MLVAHVCLACDANPVGLSLHKVKLSWVICAGDASQQQHCCWRLVLWFHIWIFSAVLWLIRREKWGGMWPAGSCVCSRTSREADSGCQCQVSSPGATPRSQWDCAVPERSNATPCLGPLDIVVLQINNRVWAADIACNVVSQVFRRTQRLLYWAVGRTGPVFRCLWECWSPKRFWYPDAGAAFPWVPWLTPWAQASP